MVLLDPRQGYTIRGLADDDQETSAEQDIHPKVLHLKLSASILEAIVISQDGPNAARLTSPSGSDPLLLVNGEIHSLHYTAETNPHQLYSSEAGSSTLKKVGTVVSKLSIGPDSQATATTWLKERRELEEARKTEHRTILLESAPVSTRARLVPSTSKLKLRAKGLAPASTNSPLIRSRAHTPNEGLSSLPGSPNMGASNLASTRPTTSSALLGLQSSTIKASPLSHSVKLATSPPTVRRRLIQLLAKGLISKRSIVQQLQQPEAAISTLLEQVGQAAPDHLQPASKRISMPANRRSLAPGQGPSASQNGDRRAATLYVLRDDVYSQVMIQEWTEYSQSERLAVSEHMEAALRRLGNPPESEEWKRLYPDGRAVNDEAGPEDALSMKRDSSGSPATDSLSKMDAADDAIVTKQPNKKKSNQDRLKSMKKNAKGRNVSRTSTPTPSALKASTPRKLKVSNGRDDEETTKVAQQESPPSKSTNSPAAVPVNLPGKATDSAQASKGDKTAKVATSRANVASRTAANAKSGSRKEIEYTDSSDEDQMQLDEPPLKAKKVVLPKGTTEHLNAQKKSSSIVAASSPSPDGKRNRQGVGSGAAFSSEPWLDVRNCSDWSRLAERFKRVYEEFKKGRAQLRAEEDMIRADLEQAQSAIIKSDSSLHVDDEEKEEGEASPVDGPARGILVMDFDPPSFANVTWRVNSEGGKFDKNATKPMTYEELETHVLKLKETEAQLTRMMAALETSKRTLNAKRAA